MSTALACMDRVARGVEILTEVMPGWAHRVDLTRFDMGSITDCVLAHLFEEGYNDGLERVASQECGWATTLEGEQWAVEYGFDPPSKDAPLLNSLWRNRIRSLQCITV